MVRGIKLFIPSNFLIEVHPRTTSRVSDAFRRCIDRIISVIRTIFCLQKPIELKRVKVGSQPKMPSRILPQENLPAALPLRPLFLPQATAIAPPPVLQIQPFAAPAIRPLPAALPPPPPIQPQPAALPPPPVQIQPLPAALPPVAPPIRLQEAAAPPAPLARAPRAAPPNSLIAGGANAFCALFAKGEKADPQKVKEERARDPEAYDRAMALFGNAKPKSEGGNAAKQLIRQVDAKKFQKNQIPKRRNHGLRLGKEKVTGNSRYLAAALGVVRALQGVPIADELDQIAQDTALQMEDVGVGQTFIDLLNAPLLGLFALGKAVLESANTIQDFKKKMDKLVNPLVSNAKSYFTGGVLITGKSDDLKVFGVIVGMSRGTRLKIYLLDVNGQIVLHKFRGPCIFKDYLYRLIDLSEMEGSETCLQYTPIILRN